MTLKLTTYRAGNLVPELPGSNTFHSTALFHLYEATPGYQPLLIVATVMDRPVAKLLGVVRRSVRWFPPGVVKRCEVYGNGEYFDPVHDREELFAAMLELLTKEALRHCFLIEFRNLDSSLFGYKAFSQNRYFAINWMRVYNSLQVSTPVEERVSPSRLRQIKKALQRGAELREARTPEEIRDFALMLHRNYSWKVRRHFPSREFFVHLEHHLVEEQQSRIFIVQYKGKIIGGSACIYSDDTAYLLFSGGLRKSYALLYPGVLAVWAALSDARKRGYRRMEFMDVGLPFRRHGYREFVLRFGGKQVSTRRWFRLRWNWLNRVLKWMYE